MIEPVTMEMTEIKAVRFGFIPIYCDTCELGRAYDEELDEWWVIHEDHKGHLHYQGCDHGGSRK